MPGLFGGGGQQTPAFSQGTGQFGTVYTPSAQPQMDTLLQQLINSMASVGQSNISQYLPQIQGAGQQALNAANLVSGTYAPQYLSQGIGLGQGLDKLSPQFTGLASQWLNPAQTSPIFQQMANQARQGAAASNAASGAYGPYAAGNTNEALKNLMLGWSAQAPQVASGLASAGAQAAQAGQNIYGDALRNYLNLVGKPQQQAINDVLGTTGSLFNLPQQSIQDIFPYLKLGQAASQLSGDLGQMGFNQNQMQLGQLGGLGASLLGAGPLGQLLYGSGGGAFGSGSGLFGGGGLLSGLFGGGGALSGSDAPVAAALDFFA